VRCESLNKQARPVPNEKLSRCNFENAVSETINDIREAEKSDFPFVVLL
jgi:hypothetical protein